MEHADHRGTAPPEQRGYAERFGLIRPRTSRQVAGVCAGIGQATGTDPVLWRVLFAVGVLLGGVGLVAYLLGWLVMPEEGDTGSPLEALFGRGRSSTSSGVTILIAGATALLLALTAQWTPIAFAVATVVGFLLYRQHRQQSTLSGAESGTATPSSTAGPSPAASPEAGPPPSAGPSSAAAPTSGAAAATATQPTTPMPGSATPPTTPMPGSAAPSAPSADEQPTVSLSTPGSDTSPTGGTGAGEPRGSDDEDTQLLRLAEKYRNGEHLLHVPPPVTGDPGGSTTEPETTRSRTPVRTSRTLTKVALFATCAALGVVGAVDLAGANIAFSGYVATALGVTGVALILGAWVGRPPGLIWIGSLLAVTLAITAAVSAVDMEVSGNRTWRPASVNELEPSYSIDLGNGTLDLRQVDFTGAYRSVRIDVNAGNFTLLLPSDVDISGEATVTYGHLIVVDEEISGSDVTRQFSDLGDDDRAGPGRLTLDITVDAGNMEVRR